MVEINDQNVNRYILNNTFNTLFYHINILLGVPEKPDFCHIANRTGTSIRVVCDPGFNGGLRQFFHIEVGLIL